MIFIDENNVPKGERADLASVNAQLETLAALRLDRIDLLEEPNRRSKIAWKIAMFANAMNHRFISLAEGVALSWNNSNFLSAVLHGRAMVETAAVSLAARLADSWGMPALTRRRSADAPQETWLVYYGDVHVGSIAIRSGDPAATDPWGLELPVLSWIPSRTSELSGTAATFDQARADFDAAWRVFLSKRTEDDFQEWRDQRDWTAEKYRRFDRGERMPHGWPARA